MSDYYIYLKSGEHIEVPPGARVVDHGYSLAIEQPHECHCGRPCASLVRSWTRDEMDARSSVSAHGLSMRL